MWLIMLTRWLLEDRSRKKHVGEQGHRKGDDDEGQEDVLHDASCVTGTHGRILRS